MTVHEPIAKLQAGPYRLRVSDFLLLDQTGAFKNHAKTELLAGEIFYVNAQHRPHARTKMALYDAIKAALTVARSPLSVLVEVSVELGEHDAPEPDLTLTSEPNGEGLVPGRSVALVVEVSDATLTEDLGRKLVMYAIGGVPEYWVADVNGRVIHRMCSPSGESYARHDKVAFGDSLSSATIDDLTIDTSSL